MIDFNNCEIKEALTRQFNAYQVLTIKPIIIGLENLSVQKNVSYYGVVSGYNANQPFLFTELQNIPENVTLQGYEVTTRINLPVNSVDMEQKKNSAVVSEGSGVGYLETYLNFGEYNGSYYINHIYKNEVLQIDSNVLNIIDSGESSTSANVDYITMLLVPIDGIVLARSNTWFAFEEEVNADSAWSTGSHRFDTYNTFSLFTSNYVAEEGFRNCNIHLKYFPNPEDVPIPIG